MSKADVVLINPDKRWIGATEVPYPPLSVMPVAGMLERNGFNPKIIDTKLTDIKKTSLGDPIFFGISAMTSRQIGYGLEHARYIRERFPEVPIVWGGIHASLLPEQTIQSELVDLVIRGEGEYTAVELAQKLEAGKPVKDIKNITFIENGKIVNNPEREFMDLDESASLCYHLLENKKDYELNKRFFYPSSRGCPHRCTFCYNTKFCRNTWRTKSVKKILEDIAWIKGEFDPERFDFNEDNFFVSKKRVEQVMDGFIKEKYDFEWAGDCRVDYFSKFDRGFLEKLKKSHCDSVFFGCESGSQRILDYTKKDITVEQILSSIKKCKKYDINPLLSFVVGFPVDTKEDVLKTMKLIDKIESIHDNILGTIISLFTPYPGAPLFDEAVKYGYRKPASLEEWGESYLFASMQNAPWLKGDLKRLVQFITVSSRLRRAKMEFSGSPFKLAKNFTRYLFGVMARQRWKHRFYDFPVEWHLWEFIQRQRGYA